ncbi:MAG TPA: carboxypeptidase-like regulatory domain-containing protein [Pyrinomonadaceae bacterium]|nr:carboxypeptidase-like regulatory domain-containing protein [Pyrinomonadaceae bacterium]
MRNIHRRVPTRLFVFILALAMLSSSVPFAVSAAQPKIKWSENNLSLQLSPGGGQVKQLTFTSDHNLQNVTIEPVPEISNLVSVQPNTIASVFADQAQTVSLFFSIPAGTSFGLHEGTIHVRLSNQTIPQTLKVSIDVVQSVDLPAELEPLSPAVISLSGVSEKDFNPSSSNIGLGISGSTFTTDPTTVQIFLNGIQVPAASVQITPTVITFAADFFDDKNELSFFGFDAEGRIVHKAATLWAGSFTLNVSIKDENNQPASGALVTARLGDDKEVKATATSVSGSVSFQNLPNRTIVLEASASGNRIASVATTGSAFFEELKLKGFNAPSTIDNNDLSQGTAGWNIGTAPVQIIPHEEGTFIPLEDPTAQSSSTQSLSAQSSTLSRAERAAQFAANSTSTSPEILPLALEEGDQDLVLNTSGEGPESISRTFEIEEGVQEIKVRYKFITSEVPGGYFGTQYNDYFNVSIRSQSAGGSASESQTMNGMGLSSFDAGGATDWREFTLPVNESADTIQVDLTVANVADGLFDSLLVVDVVSKPKVKIGDLKAVIKNDTGTVAVTITPATPAPNVTLTLATRSGTGAAQFTQNNSTSITITQTTQVEIKGLTESSTRDNIRIEAKDAQGKKLDDEDFSVLWVTISIRTSGSISSDNNAKSVIGQVQGNSSPTLGPTRHTGSLAAIGQFWGNAVELVGTVAPKNFDEKIMLDRQRLAANYFIGANNSLETGNSGGAKVDTSNVILRDDDPKPNGKIYDYDAPGLGNLPPSFAVGTTRRQRINFHQFAMWNGKKASDDFPWFARISIVKTAGTDALATDVPGDNVAGQGSTPLTWNLQP